MSKCIVIYKKVGSGLEGKRNFSFYVAVDDVEIIFLDN
jgi:hypothetical protein